jgi:DNA-binding cell septation regulator SpoVG
MSGLAVSGLRFSPATRDDSALGLLGFASFLLNDAVRVDGVGVRRTIRGKLTLSWPTREDSAGQRHPLVHPISDDARLDLESQVLAALGFGGTP